MDVVAALDKTLDEKIELSKELIKCWYEAHDGNVFVSFSGGKDSTVLLHLVRSMYPEVVGVFCNTGLEYPEIVKFVKKSENIRWVKPKKTFRQVIKDYGYPVVSKMNALKIRRLQNEGPTNQNVCRLYRTGYTSSGHYQRRWKLPKKWFYLIDAPFKISERCCDVLKKSPMNRFANRNKMYPYLGMMYGDSENRKLSFRTRSCNLYDARHPTSNPLAFWTTENVWEYIKRYDVEYCEIYDMGTDRTGCVFCMFGVHLDAEPNRFQRLQSTHPKLWHYCINKLGLKEILEYMDIPYKWEEEKHGKCITER